MRSTTMEEQIFSLDEEGTETEESEEMPAGEPEARLGDEDEEDGDEVM